MFLLLRRARNGFEDEAASKFAARRTKTSVDGWVGPQGWRQSSTAAKHRLNVEPVRDAPLSFFASESEAVF